jgi:heat shock protein HslJ
MKATKNAAQRGFAALIFLTLAGCSDSASTNATAILTDTQWQLTRIMTDRGSFDAGVLTRPPTLDFGSPVGGVIPELSVTGFGGCNVFGGSAALAGHAIAFKDLSATEMFCGSPRSDIETPYFETLGRAAEFDTEDDVLVVRGTDGNQLRFLRIDQ